MGPCCLGRAKTWTWTASRVPCLLSPRASFRFRPSPDLDALITMPTFSVRFVIGFLCTPVYIIILAWSPHAFGVNVPPYFFKFTLSIICWTEAAVSSHACLKCWPSILSHFCAGVSCPCIADHILYTNQQLLLNQQISNIKQIILANDTSNSTV